MQLYQRTHDDFTCRLSVSVSTLASTRVYQRIHGERIRCTLIPCVRSVGGMFDTHLDTLACYTI